MAGTQRRLGRMLVELGFLDDERVQQLLTAQARDGRRLGLHIAEAGYLTEDRLAAEIAKHVGFEMVDPVAAPVHARVLALLPPGTAYLHRVVPIARRREDDREALFIATADPFDDRARREVESLLPEGVSVRCFICTESEISEALRVHYGPEPRSDTVSSRPAISLAPEEGVRFGGSAAALDYSLPQDTLRPSEPPARPRALQRSDDRTLIDAPVAPSGPTALPRHVPSAVGEVTEQITGRATESQLDAANGSGPAHSTSLVPSEDTDQAYAPVPSRASEASGRATAAQLAMEPATLAAYPPTKSPLDVVDALARGTASTLPPRLPRGRDVPDSLLTEREATDRVVEHREATELVRERRSPVNERGPTMPVERAEVVVPRIPAAPPPPSISIDVDEVQAKLRAWAERFRRWPASWRWGGAVAVALVLVIAVWSAGSPRAAPTRVSSAEVEAELPPLLPPEGEAVAPAEGKTTRLEIAPGVHDEDAPEGHAFVRINGTELHAIADDKGEVVLWLEIGQLVRTMAEVEDHVLVMIPPRGPIGFVRPDALRKQKPLELLGKELAFARCAVAARGTVDDCLYGAKEQLDVCAGRCVSGTRCADACKVAFNRCLMSCRDSQATAPGASRRR